ncbi:MAG: FkbM family methyltransferase [Sulfuritalea sp.]|nr:FkbM family methyltransferase [Sulfuritalea sp.]
MFKAFKALVMSALARRTKRVDRKNSVDIHRLLDGEAIRMIDVGASGGILPRWNPYQADIAFVGLEPDSRSFRQLQVSEDAKQFNSYKLIPWGAWNTEGKINISFTRKPMCSSHFQPNTAFLSRFQNAERFEVVGSGEVECQTLDSLQPDLGDGVDFIKLDLEGGELAVLQGAKSVLCTCLGLHVEVCFQHLRVGQPLFGDITAFLVNQGMEFVDFVTMMRWERDHYREIGQAVFADALYLRSPEGVIEMIGSGALAKSRATRYLAILAIYDRVDLAVIFLELAKAAGVFTDSVYLSQAQAVMARKAALMDKRVRFLNRLSFAYAQWSNPNSALHYIY